MPLASSWNLAGYKLTNSPQDYASTTAIVEIAVAICLKSLKSLLGGAFLFTEAVFFARILQELFGQVVLNFDYFGLKNITFHQKILFSNAVVDLLNHSGFLVWISPISAASRLQCFLTLLSQMWPLLIWGQCLIRGRLIPVNWVKNLSQFSWAFCDVNHAIIFLSLIWWLTSVINLLM